MKKHIVGYIALIITPLLFVIAAVWGNSKKQFTYGLSNPKSVQHKFERHAMKIMVGALSMAHFAGRIEEATKCPCTEVITHFEKGQVNVEINYDKCRQVEEGK